MVLKRGNIHLAKLYPSKGHEVGKNRPVLILQTDLLNEVEHTTAIVLPLSTSKVANAYPLRYDINKRDKLMQDSQILCDQIRAIDINRIDKEILSSLTNHELLEIQLRVQIILDFS